MKRFLSLFCVWIFLLSCTQNTDENSVLSSQGSEPVSPYAVSESEALQSLAVALQQIDGEDETRAGGVRKPLSIRSVKASDVFETTRSADIPDLDNLLYVVSFGEGNGSAVLGADSRVEPVIAILDETVLTEGDFIAGNEIVRSVISDESDELLSFLTERIITAVGAQVMGLGGPGGLPPIEPIELWRGDPEKRVTDKYLCSPRLKTKWHQNSPYNDSVPDRNDGNGKCYAGCTSIAVTQFLYNMQYPGSNQLSGRTYDWNLIEECEYGSVPSNAARLEIADYVATIGAILQTEYHHWTPKDPETATASLANAVPLLAEFGVASQYVGFSTDSARSIVCEKGPICVCGSSASNIGHAWVIDGWNSYHETTIVPLYNGLGILVREEVVGEKDVKLLHCNYGWRGLCDGYYSYSTLVFDTSTPLDDKDIDYTIGDRKGGSYDPDEYKYDRSIYMLKY